MPQNKNSSELPKVMTWTKAMPVLILCGLFDLIRLFFEGFIFFGPALAGVLCTVAGSSALGGGSVATWVSGTACATGAIVVGTVGVETTAVIGIVGSEIVGLAGWMIIGLILMMFNGRIFKENLLWFVVSLFVSEVPFVGGIPVLTFTVRNIYSNQIKIEKAALKKYEEEQEVARIKEQQQALSLQQQAGQIIQAEQEAANDEQYAEEVANDTLYDQEGAAGGEKYGDEEIPAHEKLAA